MWIYVYCIIWDVEADIYIVSNISYRPRKNIFCCTFSINCHQKSRVSAGISCHPESRVRAYIRSDRVVKISFETSPKLARQGIVLFELYSVSFLLWNIYNVAFG